MPVHRSRYVDADLLSMLEAYAKDAEPIEFLRVTPAKKTPTRGFIGTTKERMHDLRKFRGIDDTKPAAIPTDVELRHLINSSIAEAIPDTVNLLIPDEDTESDISDEDTAVPESDLDAIIQLVGTGTESGADDDMLYTLTAFANNPGTESGADEF